MTPEQELELLFLREFQNVLAETSARVVALGAAVVETAPSGRSIFTRTHRVLEAGGAVLDELLQVHSSIVDAARLLHGRLTYLETGNQ